MNLVEMAHNNVNDKFLSQNIKAFFNKYGYNKPLPLNSYFSDQKIAADRKNHLNRIETIQSKLQPMINAIPNGNNKNKYKNLLIKSQELPNLKKQTLELLRLRRTIIHNKQQQQQQQQLIQKLEQQAPIITHAINDRVTQLSEILLKKIDNLRNKQIRNRKDISRRGKLPLINSIKKSVLDNLETGIKQVIHPRQANLDPSRILIQLEEFRKEILRYEPVNDTAPKGGRRRTHRK